MIGSLLVVLSLVVGLAPAEETYTIKVKKSAKGDVTRIEEQGDGENKMVVTIGGKEAPGQAPQGKEGRSEVYVQTILEKPDKAEKATSLTRKYEKARVTREGKEQTRVYEGKTVLIEKKGDKYRFQIEGGKELTDKDAEELDREFNKKEGISDEEFEKLLLPSKPVKIGESWKIDGDRLFKDVLKEGGLGGDGAKASGKLLEVYDKDGRKFGKMDVELTSPITQFGGDGAKLKVADGSKFGIVFHIDVCIDGTSADGSMKAETAIDVEGSFDAGGMEAKFVLHGKNVASKKETEQSKK